MGASQDSLLELGEGAAWPRRIQKGSPEHHLLTEAKVIPGGSRLPGRIEAGMRTERSPRWKGFGPPAGPEEATRTDEDQDRS